MIMKTSAPLNKIVLLGVVLFITNVCGLAIASMGTKAVIGLLLLLLLIVVAKYPELGLLYFSVGFDSFSYVGALLNIPLGIRSFVFASGLIYILCIFIFIRRKNLACLVDKTLIAAVFLGVIYAVSALLHQYSGYGIYRSKGYLLFNLFAMGAAILFSKEPLAQRRMIYAAAFGCLISNISLFFMIKMSGSIEFGRFVTAYSNPIWLSRTIGVLIFANIAVFAVYKNKWLRLCLFVSSVIGIYFMLMTGSRGPIISFIFVLIIFFLTSYKIGFKKKIFAIACTIACFFIVSQFIQDETIMYRYASLVMVEYESYDYGSTQTRQRMFRDAVEQFFRHPVIGEGAGTSYPHNLTLEIAGELGSVGLLIFLYFIITSAKIAASLLPKNILVIRKEEMFKTWAVMCFLFGFLNSCVSGTIVTNFFVWFAAGCLIAARNTPNKMKRMPA